MRVVRDPHVQRQEKAAWITLAQAKLSKDLRAERSKQLKKVLLSGNSGNLLYGYKPGTSEPLSVAQVTRLNTQAFAVLRMYETFDMFEQRCEIPAEGAVKGAALMVGQHLGYNEKTVRGWLIDYETDGFFAADSRGKAERELMSRAARSLPRGALPWRTAWSSRRCRCARHAARSCRLAQGSPRSFGWTRRRR